MSCSSLKAAALFAAVALSAFNLPAQAATVLPNGTLTKSTSSVTVDNALSLIGSGASGFNFSGATGDFSSAISPKGYFYSTYLFTVASSTAESVVTTLNNASGVANLSERIYAYNGGFLGDAVAGPSIIQAWSSNLSFAGTSISVVSPKALTAGQYVIEVRGTSQGNFGGSLSVTPVPEPQQYALLIAGLGVIGVLARRRRF